MRYSIEQPNGYHTSWLVVDTMTDLSIVETEDLDYAHSVRDALNNSPGEEESESWTCPRCRTVTEGRSCSLCHIASTCPASKVMGQPLSNRAMHQIKRDRKVPLSEADREFIDWLEDVLLPDLTDSEQFATVQDIERLIQIVRVATR